LPVLKRHRIPILWTLHDYIIICPENCFISHDKICEKCKGGKFYHCAIQRCKKKSFLASSLAATENYIHHYLNVFKCVDYFLCPSNFLYQKFLEFNFHKEKLVLTNLCLEFETMPLKKETEDFILFVGSLIKIKGVITLLKAVATLDIQVRIAGDGQQAAEIRKFISDNQLPNISLLGHMPKNEVYSLLQKATILVCPSESYENFPFSVIEAMSMKTPVIASAIGGIPELVVHEQTGLLFEPFNFIELRESIVRLYNDKQLQVSLAENAYARTSKIVNYHRHYNILKDIYSNLNLDL
jgi:glycosyltransferase involved in cell wall biosynthesis